MGTKLKKSRLYSKGMKVTAAFAIMLMTISFVLSFVGMIWLVEGFTYRFDDLYSKNRDYTETNTFSNEFQNLLDEAVMVNVHYKSEGYIREGNAIDEIRFMEDFKNYYGIMDGVITSSTVIVDVEDTYEVKLIDSEIPNDLLNNYNEYSELVSSKLRSYKNMYIQNQLDEFNLMKDDLTNYVNFYYYIENAQGFRVSGNMKKDDITSLERYIILDRAFLFDKMNMYTSYYHDVIENGDYILYAGIPETFVYGDKFYDDSIEFKTRQEIFPYLAGGLILSFLVALVLVAYLVRVSGQQEKGGEVKLKAIDKVYNDIQLGFSLCSVAGLLYLMAYTSANIYFYSYDNYDVHFYMGFSALLLVMAVLAVCIVLGFLCSMSRQLKEKRLINNTLIVTIVKKIGLAITRRSFIGWVMILFITYTIILCIIPEPEIIVFLIGPIAGIILLHNLRSITKIMSAAKSASKGDYRNIDTNKVTSMFSDFATDVNNIQSGLKSSIQEAVKGERMKADLVTNVSHDLKTPLTSIISYVDLLDREELNNPTAEKYVGVLVEKSERLKQLIDDLIEASKASTGNLSVEKTKINLKELMLQACGEFEEKAKSSKLEFRIATNGEVNIFADGKHMWRIYENLLTNVIKYAMVNSRIYIDIYKEAGFGVMVMKNVSQNEITVNPENLTERFVRGDSARTTEGSGLGLSIANSLALIQEGKFDISVDGDMFKVKVSMPLYKGETEELNPPFEAEAIKEVKPRKFLGFIKKKDKDKNI